MNLGTHRSQTAERNSTGADTEGCAPSDTTATSTGEIRNRAQASRCPSGTPTEDDLGAHQVGQQRNSTRG